MQFAIRRLEEEDRTEEFDCGDAALNQYLRRYAYKNQERFNVGVTYIGITGEHLDIAIGYYTLASTSLPTGAFPPSQAKVLSPYAEIPSILLARLAVDRRFQGRGVGQQLLRDALKRTALIAQLAGCRCILVDAYTQAVPWYQAYGFIPITGAAPSSKTQKMYLDLRTLAKVVQ